MSTDRTCSVDGCEDVKCRVHFSRSPHHRRWTVDPDTGCWNWDMHVSADGYGRVSAGGVRGRWAHRWSYEIHVGPIPVGLTIDHLCRNKRCVNPAHLEAVTSAVNTRRCPDAPTTINALKTHCVHGHPLDLANTRITKDGSRACKTCSVDRVRRWTARQRVAA